MIDDEKRVLSRAHRSTSICLHNMHFEDAPPKNHAKIKKRINAFLPKILTGIWRYFNNNKPDLFVGREDLIKKLVNLLCQTSNSRGCYLIAGYRGVGKTSVIDRVIKEYDVKPKCKKIRIQSVVLFLIIIRQSLSRFFLFPFFSRPKDVIQIPVNLGESQRLNPENIYFSIASILYDKLNSRITLYHKIFSYFLIIIIVSSLILLLLPLAHHLNASTYNKYIETHGLFYVFPDFFEGVLCYYSLLFFTFIISVLFWLLGKIIIKKIFGDLETLKIRMRYNIEEQQQFSAKQGWFSFGKNRVLKSLPLQTREMEYELIKILSSLRNPYLLDADIIFIFDEIDKLSEQSLDEDNKLSSSRKLDKINELFSSIKYFITTAKARFFIISGHETLDSYYSERGSANSLYESLFDQVFEIPSLLTDSIDSSNYYNIKSNSKLKLTSTIEEYICVRLGNRQDSKLEEPFRNLNEYYHGLISIELEKTDYQDKRKQIDEARSVVHVLRNFIYFLAFHSWGNPKRLAAILANYNTLKNPIQE